jgi:hypothetical protein
MLARALLERIYGFAEPTAVATGRLIYTCVYCDAHATTAGGPAPHTADCPYWHARATLDSPVAHQLFARLAGDAA